MAKKRGKKNKPKAADSSPVVAASQISPSPGTILTNPILKVCRLCASKEGPFTNIFDPEMGFSTKVQILLPFVVAENNNLPQNICFRCTVKVEDFYEFLAKCINTHKDLHISMNCMNEVALKEVVKKAVEKMQIVNRDGDYPILPIAGSSGTNTLPKRSTSTVDPSLKHDSTIGQAHVSLETKTCVQEPSTKIAATASNLPIGMEIPTPEDNKLTRSLRSNVVERQTYELNVQIPKLHNRIILGSKTPTMQTVQQNRMILGTKTPTVQTVQEAPKMQTDNSDQNEYKSGTKSKKIIGITPEERNDRTKDDTIKPKDFDIMNHITTQKCDGVGPMFRCNICNRNFLNMDVVMTHGCAKNGTAPTEMFAERPQEPLPLPKIPTVKYINTRPGGDACKTNSEIKTTAAPVRTKPRIGPASKIRRPSCYSAAEETMASPVIKPAKERVMSVNPAMSIHPRACSSAKTTPVQNPIVPGVNSRFHLVPGPKNTYSLVEDISHNNPSTSDASKQKPVDLINTVTNTSRRQEDINDSSLKISRQAMDNKCQPKRRQLVDIPIVTTPIYTPISTTKAVVDKLPMKSLAIAKPPPPRRKSLFISVPQPMTLSKVEPEDDCILHLSDDEVTYVPNEPTPKSQPGNLPHFEERTPKNSQEEPTKPPPAKRVRKSVGNPGPISF